MIDGIWQITPDYIKIDDPALLKIIFFNSSTEPSEPVKSTKYSTFKLVDSMSKSKRNIEYKPIFHIDIKTSNLQYDEVLAKSEAWFDSKYQVFHKSNLECWFIAILIEELIQNIDKDVLRYSIFNMQRRQLLYKIVSEDYLNATAAVITAFIVTNARVLYEGIDNSIIYHYWTHNKVNRCPFSIFDIESYINSKGIIDRYLPFLIFRHLFRKLYDHIFTVLQGDIDLSFNYSNIMEFNVPDYIIVQKDNCYEIFEIEED